MYFTFNKKKMKLIMLSLSGSRLYGTNTKDSDWDYRGVFIADYKDRLGIEAVPNQITGSENIEDIMKLQNGYKLFKYDDVVLFELKHFIQLAAQNNPNIIDILFSDKRKIIETFEWKEIERNRNLFLSKKIKHTFLGYAHQQLKRMIIFKGKDNESRRAKTIAKYGYDTKNAMHLVRLLLSAESILKNGSYNPEASKDMKIFLNKVRNGEFSYDYLQKFKDDFEESCLKLYEISTLQHKPKLKEINKLLIKLSLEGVEK